MSEEEETGAEYYDAAFIKNNEDVKNIGKLLEIIYHLNEENFTSSVEKIEDIGFKNENQIINLARNIIKVSCFHRSKIHLLVRLVSQLKTKIDIVPQIETLVDFAIHVGAEKFLLSLIDAKIINSSFESKLKRAAEKCRLQEIIEEDDVESLKDLFTSPDFDINDLHDFKIPKLIKQSIYKKFTLIKLTAISGSVSCFRFLFINNANLRGIIKFAVSGGSVEIIQILEQAGIHIYKSCIVYAILYHRVEIFDWFIDRFPKIDYSYECIANEFVHGINLMRAFEPQAVFEDICSSGIFSLVEQFLPFFTLRVESGLRAACFHGHIEIVKLLLSVPSIDVNDYEVQHLFSLFAL